MGKAVAAEKAAQGKLVWSVLLNDDKVKFDHGRALLSTSAASELDSLAQNIKGYGKALYLEIEGHTDSSGEEQFNLQLGESRAAAVRNYLLEKGGLPLHAMSTISYGESKPVADNSTQDGRSQNRRVVIRVLE
jgi:outer membrane protein OmpA-like peptidoglycan-associated protein